MSVQNVTDSGFAEAVKSDGLVVVDFWAEWCAPCVAMGMALEEIIEDENPVKIIKVNVDKNPVSASQFGVRSIPTLVLFKDGEPIDMNVGAASKSDLKAWIEKDR